MQIRWSKLIAKMAIWVGAEIGLTLAGMDDLADYSEFMHHSHVISLATRHEICLVV